MAPVVEGVIVWLSDCSSSLQISILSAFFIIIYVTVYGLCASCYSEMHLYRQDEKNIPFPRNKSAGVTEQFSRNLNRLENGQSQGHLSQELISTPSKIHAVSMGTSSPQSVKTLPLPSLPSDPTAHLEPLRHTPSFHHQECVASCSDEYIPTTKDLTDHIYSLLDSELNEENIYEYISDPPLLPQSDRGAEGDSERSSPIMTEMVELDGNHSDTALSNPVSTQETEQPIASPHSPSDQCLTCTQPTVVYAEVNWKTKHQKNTDAVLDTYVVDKMNDIAEVAPPIPDKHF